MAWDNHIPLEEQQITERILMLTHSVRLLRMGRVRAIHKEAIELLETQIKKLKETPIATKSKSKKNTAEI